MQKRIARFLPSLILFRLVEKYILLPILHSGGIMKIEIDNKRQDVEDCSPLHPYAGEPTSPTQHIMRLLKYSEFPALFQGKTSAYLGLRCCIFSGVGKKYPAPLSYRLSRQILAEGYKNMPPLLNCSRFY